MNGVKPVYNRNCPIYEGRDLSLNAPYCQEPTPNQRHLL